jgi:hypothetical protein
MSDLTPEQQAEIDALAALPDDEIDTSDAPELDWGAKPDEEHNFFAEHGIPDAEERFRVFKMFREMYGEDKLRFPSFFEGYRLGSEDGNPDLNTLLDFAVRAICYVGESMPEKQQETLAGHLFQLIPKVLFEKDLKSYL